MIRTPIGCDNLSGAPSLASDKITRREQQRRRLLTS
jgi:hypothetical protein